MKQIHDTGIVPFPECNPSLVSPSCHSSCPIDPSEIAHTFPIICSSHVSPALLTTVPRAAASVRAQIDKILAFPSLLGVSRCAGARRPSLLADIDNDNATPAPGDGEGCHAVTDLQTGHFPADSLPEATLFPRVSPPKARNQTPVRQRIRHRLHPSDPSPTTINRADHDRDRGQCHQPTPLAHPFRSNSAIPNSPDSGPDRDIYEGNPPVSCLVADNYTRCPACLIPWMYAGVWGFSEAWRTLVLINTLRFPGRPGLFTRRVFSLVYQTTSIIISPRYVC